MREIKLVLQAECARWISAATPERARNKSHGRKMHMSPHFKNETSFHQVRANLITSSAQPQAAELD